MLPKDSTSHDSSLLGWDLLFQRSNDAMLMVDADLNIIDANETGLKLCNIGRNLSDIDSISSKQDERRTITSSVRWSLDQRTNSEGRVIFLKQNNADVEVDIYPVSHPDQGAVVIIKEPTESLNHRELKGEPEKLYRLGMTAAGITHELSNPVSALYSQLELMQSQLTQPDTQLQTCLDLVSRIRMILRELSGIMEHTSALEPRSIDLYEFLPHTINLLKFCPTGREVNMFHTISEDIPLLNIREKHLMLLLDNICDNALKAVEKGGRIDIDASSTDDGGIELRCSNSGRNISQEAQIQKDIYHQGMGVGLMITRQIIESYQGSINISRAADGGTEVQLSFPAQCCQERLDSE
ncbi:sensor histidine kinase [Amphritea japonica]|uniref:histidine kinase n=1 Tax=Amphritea japonica ATCC BAA-1530 TaxID=1278309 RepID=A0A7R6STJ2_9GAMM|nr:HAMP domain-containing sensor histidine kinase [Amphritea japonica]BBB26760.1 two-component system sensor histidine kinase and response regulator [Amphritea japonica ATCC BAA-1530]